MNYQERKVYTSLLLVQGSYYMILGLLMVSIPLAADFYHHSDLPEIRYNANYQAG